MSQANEPSDFSPFEAVIDRLEKTPSAEKVILEVLWLSPKDGSELDLVSIPLRLSPAPTSP